MINQQILEGNWNEIKGKLRQKWGQLTDDDFPQICGEADQIIGIIRTRLAKGAKRLNGICKKCPAALPRRSARRPKPYATMHSTLPRPCSIRPSELPTRCMPAITRRNASSAIGRESRCLCVSEWG